MESKRVISAIAAALCVLIAAGGCATTTTSKAQLREAESALAASEAPPPSHGPGWYNCDVHKVGPGWTNVYLRLSSSSFGQRWFIARADQEKEMLATGLTAVTLGKQVNVNLSGTAEYSEIRACYIIK